MAEATTAENTQTGILGWVERTGNKLPDPVFIFFYLIIALVVVSIVASLSGVSALHPTAIDESTGSALRIDAVSLLSPENIQRLWVEMPATFTHFHPLGYVLVVMLGAGVAERSGLFSSAIRAAVRNAPKFLLTPLVALVAMLSNHAADAGYVVMIPLAGILFASAGRHPLAGIAAAFAGVSGGFSANISPGQLDALLFGITEAAYGASNIDAGWTMNIAGNAYFIAALLFIYLPVIWFVTDKIIEPRLGKWVPSPESAVQAGDEDEPLTAEQQKGLRMAGLALLGVCALWAFMTFGPGTPLLADGPGTEGNPWYQKAGPFFRSLVAGFLVLFLAAGWAYGAAANTINNHRDLVNMMAEAMKDMGYYLVLAFAAATGVAPQQVAMIGDSLHDLGAGRAAGAILWQALVGERFQPQAGQVFYRRLGSDGERVLAVLAAGKNDAVLFLGELRANL